jgi:hypothetical protein
LGKVSYPSHTLHLHSFAGHLFVQEADEETLNALYFQLKARGIHLLLYIVSCSSPEVTIVTKAKTTMIIIAMIAIFKSLASQLTSTSTYSVSLIVHP